MQDLYILIAKVLEINVAAVGPETGPGNEPRWDSFSHVHVMIAVEDRYGIELNPEEIATLLTVNDIASLLRSMGVEGLEA